MNIQSLVRAVSASIIAVALVACGKSVEGTYTIVEGPVTGVKLTLGKDRFSFATGANGTYEVSGDKVIFTSMTFGGTMRIEGSDLVNEKFRFRRD